MTAATTPLPYQPSAPSAPLATPTAAPTGNPTYANATTSCATGHQQAHQTVESLSGSLGIGSIVFMVIAAAAPLTVLGGGTPVGILLGNGAAFPATFLIAGTALALFSVGLSAMTRFVPHSGAFFAYVSRGLNPAWGLGTAMLALMTYTAIQLSVYCLIGLQLETGISTLTGVDVPWWLYSFLVLTSVAFLGYRHIEMSSKVLGLLLIAEIAVAVILAAVILLRGGAHGIDLAASFSPHALTSGSIGVALMFSVAGFIGFESTAVYRSEAKDPDRTIPIATYIAVAFVTVLYTISSFAMVTAWGSDSVQSVAADTLAAGNMLQLTGELYLGAWYAALISVLLITSLFACVLSFHNVLSRYMFSLSHAGALPAALGGIHTKHQSPSRASLAQTATAASILAIITLCGVDPYAQGFTWLSGMSTVGFVSLMALTCLSVVVFFIREHYDVSLWSSAIAPGVAMVALGCFLYAILTNFPTLVGDTNAAGKTAAGPLTFTLLGLLAISFIAGMIQALVMKRRDADAYCALSDAA